MTPELILACAKKAFPQLEWKIYPGSDTTVFDGRGGSFTLDLRGQMALQIELEKDWIFTRSLNHKIFVATNRVGSIILEADSKPAILAKCVQATVETMEGGGK